MASVVLFSLSIVGLSGTVSYDGEAILARVEGVVDQAPAHKGLEDLLSRLTAETKLLRTKQVVLDVRALEFLDMTGFKGLVAWVSSVRDLGPETQFKIRFLSSLKMFWQRKNLEAIRCLAAGVVTVETR